MSCTPLRAAVRGRDGAERLSLQRCRAAAVAGRCPGGATVSEGRLADLCGPALSDVEILRGCGPLTLGGFLLEVCRRHPGNEALVFDDPLRGGDTVRWSYADLERESRRVARALLASGLGKG